MRSVTPTIALSLLLSGLVGCSESPTPVDAGDGGDGGPGDLRVDRQPLETPDLFVIPDLVPSSSDRCGGGPVIDLTPGTVTVNGDTAGANNEFGDAVRCGNLDGYPGPQRYYQVALTEGRTYRFTVRPEFEAVGYLASGCAANVINADCGSSGATGTTTGAIAAGGEGSVIFIPGASGVFHFAVDSASATARGKFELRVEAFAPPANAACAKAEPMEPLSPAGGASSVSASTLGASNEFDDEVTCGLGLTFDGPQRYYSLALEQGAWYRLSIAADFAAALYVVNQAGECESVNIEQDCSNITGTILPPITAGAEGATIFSPPASGTYLLVVDGIGPLDGGEFTLTVEQIETPGNQVCASATPVTLIAGRTVIRGDTGGRLNDRGAQLTCGGPPLTGPQAYYAVPLVGEKSYLLTLTSSFDAVLAVGESCVSLPADCSSAGLSGTGIEVAASTIGTVSFRPASSGEHVVVVDGLEGAEGKFKLTIAELSGPTNDQCTAPAPLSPGAAGQPLTVKGDTGPLTDDLPGVDCGAPAGPWPGPQAYYRVTVGAGQSFRLDLMPEPTFDAALYAFAAQTACETAAVNGACANLVSDLPGGGVKESLTLTAAGDYVVAVDSWSKSDVGTFTLVLEQLP